MAEVKKTIFILFEHFNINRQNIFNVLKLQQQQQQKQKMSAKVRTKQKKWKNNKSTPGKHSSPADIHLTNVSPKINEE